MSISTLGNLISFKEFKELSFSYSLKQNSIVLRSEVWLLPSLQSTGVDYTRGVWKLASAILGLFKSSGEVW